MMEVAPFILSLFFYSSNDAVVRYGQAFSKNIGHNARGKAGGKQYAKH